MEKDFEILWNVAVANDINFLVEAIDDLYNKYWSLSNQSSDNRWSVEYCMEFIRNHTKGHLPPIIGAEKLEKALEVLKIRNDYEVVKPVIYASKRNGANSGLQVKLTNES